MDYNERKLVSDFTGLPVASDPKKDQSPKRFSTIIDKVWETWKIGTQESPEKKISENWEQLVGLRLANKCAPERLDSRSGVLFIRTSGGAVRQELSFQKKTILGKITRLGGCSAIKEIKFI